MVNAVNAPQARSPQGSGGGAGRARRTSLSLYSGAGAGYSSSMDVPLSPSGASRPSNLGLGLGASPDVGTSLQGRAHSVSVGARPGGRPSLDELLKDLDHIPSADALQQQPPPHRMSTSSMGTPSKAGASNLSQHSSSLTGISKQKCLAVWVAGPSNERGRAGAQVGRLVCCDNIRCTKCDFKVCCFANRAWDSGVDYLFFRNNFPTDSKLAPMMLKQAASSAYCCQCSWFTAEAEHKIDFGSDLRWVCGGHSL